MRASFAWHGERYQQKIYGVAAGKATLLLESDEAPLQEAVEHGSADGRRTLLFTGSDGRYWSAAVVAAKTAVEFDFACRSPRNEHSPTLAYRMAAGVTATSDHVGALILCTKESGAYRLQAVDEAMPSCRLGLTGDRIEVEAVGSSWRYTLARA